MGPRHRAAAAVLAVPLGLVCAAPNAAGALELDGRVVDAAGAPLAGATVSLERVPPFYERALQILDGARGRAPAVKVKSSGDGVYRVRVPEPGMWQVEVSAPGRVPLRCRLLPLLADETLPDVALEPDAGVEVSVRDESGSPLAGAQVWIRPLDSDRPRGRPSLWVASRRHGRTGEDGRATLAAAASWKIGVHAYADGYLAVASEEPAGPSVSLTLRRGRGVRMRLLNAAGAPVPGAVLTASQLNWVAGATDELGEARVFVQPGRALPLTARLATGQVEATEVLVSEPDPGEAEEAEIAREWRLPEPVPLAGRVVDAQTREEIARAMVWTPEDIGAVTHSDADGRYSLLRGSSERWRLWAAAPGYGRSAAEVVAEAGGPRESTLALERTGILSGRVADPEGEPIAGALLGVSGRFQSLLARSGADGRFRLGGLTAGRQYELSAEAEGFAADYRRMTFEPGKELRILLYPGRAIVGRLVDPDGEPVAAGRVYLVEVETDPRMRGFSSRTRRLPRVASDADGRFRLVDLPPRPAALVARARGLADAIVREVRLDEADGVIDLGDIELGWGISLHGVVLSSDGEAVEGAEVSVFGSAYDPVRLGVQSEEDSRSAATTDAEGRFLIEGLLEERGLSGSVRHRDHVDRWLQRIDVDPAQPLEIVLEKGARVSGWVRDDLGAPVGEVRVEATTLARADPSADPMRVAEAPQAAFSDADGSFEITGIAPGRITLGAGSGMGWIAPEPPNLVLSAGEERRGVVVRVSRGAELAGTVTDEDSRPVSGAGVRVSARMDSQFVLATVRVPDFSGFASTDGDGLYSMKGLESGKQAVIVVQHPDYAERQEAIEIRPGKNRLDLVLERGANLSGRVLTEAGEPVEGAQIELNRDSTGVMVRMGDTRHVESAADGSFTVGGLSAGVHRVRARKPGFAESEPVTVDLDGPAPGPVVLTLRRGGTIRGRILGLEPAEVAGLQVYAADPQGGLAVGLVGESAEYRIPNVAFESGRVLASSEAAGRMVSEPFTLDPRGGETWVDLEFGGGFRLSGRVLRNGEPYVGVRVLAHGSSDAVGSASTDETGGFAIEGLEEGLYQVLVAAIGSLSHAETVRVAGDTEITVELASVRVSGRVVAEEDRRPVAGATVTAAAEGDPLSALMGQHTLTAAGGEFELDVPVRDRMTIRARATGHAEASVEVDAAGGGEISGIELVLGPGDELELAVRLWTGASAETVSVALLDASGRRVRSDTLMAPSPGSFRFASAPPGDWTLLVVTQQSAVVARPVTIPGPPVEIVLPQGANVSVEIAESLVRPSARVRLISPTGEVLRLPVSGAVLTEMPVFGAKAEISFVPAGDWVVELVDPEAGARRQAVTAVAGETVRVSFD